MSINFSNVNTLWASILAETLYRLGGHHAIICPGSRSAPFAVAFASHGGITAIPILDERSAAFFALGLARQCHRPVILVCTSGTAAANFYPAVIEAKQSGVPLLVLTADRPPELRDCNAGQAIDQHKLYGTYPNWQAEMALPSLDLSLLAYLRQTIQHAWEMTLYPTPGPVHLNQPFRDPLAPIPDPRAQTVSLMLDCDQFFAAVTSGRTTVAHAPNAPSIPDWAVLSSRGLIIAGPAQPEAPEAYCRAIAHLSNQLGYPVLAEALSPVRNYASLNPNLITTYDLILRQPSLADKLSPDTVIRIGEMPTSKQLRAWLDQVQPRQWVIDPHRRNLDPLHGHTTHLRLRVESLTQQLRAGTAPTSSYLDQWRATERATRQRLDQVLGNMEQLFESKVAWLLAKVLPPRTPLFISSSMPVRDMEFFWAAGDTQIAPHFNRGANGIDGSLSTALGVAYAQLPGVMLTGDLALLHDTNGFLLRQGFQGHLTIVLINNNGGGIFEMLPISRFESTFEDFFATPQNINFARLCLTYGVEYERIQSWEQLSERLIHLPTEGVRVLEIPTDRKADALWRQNNLGQFAVNLYL